MKLRTRNKKHVEIFYCPYSVNNEENLESFGIGLENKFTTPGSKPASRLIIDAHGVSISGWITNSGLDSVSFLAPEGYTSFGDLKYLLLNTNEFLDVYKYGEFPDHLLCGDYVSQFSMARAPRSILERISHYLGRRIIEQTGLREGALVSGIQDVLGGNLSTQIASLGPGDTRFFQCDKNNPTFSYKPITDNPMDEYLRAITTREGIILNAFLSNYTDGDLTSLPEIGDTFDHTIKSDICIPPIDLCVMNRGEIPLSELLLALHNEFGISPSEVRLSSCRGGRFTQRQAWATTAGALSATTSRKGGITAIPQRIRENFINLSIQINRMNYRKMGLSKNKFDEVKEYENFQFDLAPSQRESAFMANSGTLPMPVNIRRHSLYPDIILQHLDLESYKLATTFLRTYLNAVADIGEGLKTDWHISKFR